MLWRPVVLGVDIINDSSFSSSETDLDSDGNVRFSEFGRG